MKKIILFIILFINVSLYAQNWAEEQLPNSNSYTIVRASSFIDPEHGWLITGKEGAGVAICIYRTSDKGNNWSLISSGFNDSKIINGTFDIQFLNQSVGYMSCGFYDNIRYYNNLYKTSNGGVNWNQVSEQNGNIHFINETTGFLMDNPGEQGKLYKTTNSGVNWTPIYTLSGFHIFYGIKLINNNLYAYGSSYDAANHRGHLLKSTNLGSSFTELANNSSYDNLNEIRSVDLITSGTEEKILFSTYNKFGSINSSNNVTIINNSGLGIYEMGFANENYGLAAGALGLYRTTNGGTNFISEASNITGISPVTGSFKVFNQVAYVGSFNHPQKFFVRELGTNFNTYYDNISSGSNVVISGTTHTNTFEYIRGGTLNYSCPWLENPNESNERRFLKWGDGNRINIPQSLNYISSGSFTNYYKTKNLSNDFSAISKPSSTKALKEAHSYVDRLHTSLGNIFFSRSTNNGTSFSTEEIVSNTYTLADNNINPHLAEVKTNLPGGVDEGKNSSVVWERRDGNNINIMYSQREVVGSSGIWGVEPVTTNGGNSFSVNAANLPDFQCLPKVSSLQISTTSNAFFTVISYLKPNGSSVTLEANVKPSYTVHPYEKYTVATGNITDFAITTTQNSMGNGIVVHYVYKKDNHIYYKAIDYYVYTPIFGATVRTAETLISAGDGNTSRNTPDISLRSGPTAGSYLPIVTYQGVLPMTRVYSVEDVSASSELPETHTVQFTQYPIMVTYLKSDGTGWSNPSAQPSSGTIVQSDPNIEGCATGNGYILNFRKGNSGYYQYTNLQNYHCDPPAFLGTDAKLIRGSYTTPTGGALLTTLTNESPLYRLGKQNVSITNVNSQVQDGVYGNIKGVVNMNDIDYVFNMGPIIVAAGPQVDMPLFGDALNEAAPVSGIEFNEYLRSEPFALNNGDTLILGATANYIAVDKQNFYPLKYTVNLMNAYTEEVTKVLFSDTIHIEDEEMTEYYRGFVFNDLNPLEGNVYLQITVEDVSGNGAKYNYVGVYQGESEVADRSGRIDPTQGVFIDFGHGRQPSNVLNVKPTSYNLAQNYPNPFNPSTTIRYSIPNDGLVQMRIYDISGREVMNLVNENKVAGNYEVKFNGANLSSGIYFYRINAGEFVQTKRMVLLK